MTTAQLHVEAPTDAQLAYIDALCRDRGLIRPQAVASKAEASTIIGAMLDGSYDYELYDYPWGVPFR